MPSKSSGRKQASSRQSAAVRHRERTEQTRSRLLAAGRSLFARDGFEGAKLEEIASEAGYTRGALYANFESKEDLFIAMLEENIQERISYARKLLAKQHDLKKRIAAFRQLFMEKARERSWTLLWLEFKLFALRHPEFKVKLSEMRQRVSLLRRKCSKSSLEKPAELSSRSALVFSEWLWGLLLMVCNSITCSINLFGKMRSRPW